MPTKLTDENVVDIRTRFAAGGVSQAALAREFDVNPSTITYIVTGKRRVKAGGPITLDNKMALTEVQAKRIFRKRLRGASLKELAEEYGVSMRTVSQLCQGKTYKSVNRGRGIGRVRLKNDGRRGATRKPREKGFKLTPEKVRAIRKSYENGARQRELAKAYSVSIGLISQIVNRKVWTNVE